MQRCGRLLQITLNLWRLKDISWFCKTSSKLFTDGLSTGGTVRFRAGIFPPNSPSNRDNIVCRGNLFCESSADFKDLQVEWSYGHMLSELVSDGLVRVVVRMWCLNAESRSADLRGVVTEGRFRTSALNKQYKMQRRLVQH